MKKRAAIYLRVSRGEQCIENQRPAIVRLARARKLKLVFTFEESASAAHARPQLRNVMAAAHRGDFDVLIVWSLDRLGRSMTGNLQAVLELDRCGVEVLSVREPWLDTGGPVRPLLIAIFGWVAEQERMQIAERTKAGMARVRRKGVRFGRPKRRIDMRRAKLLRGQGLSLRDVAQQLKVPLSTLHRALCPEKGSDFDGA